MLENIGYKRTEIVEGKGHYSVRGGIVDVFTPNYNMPVRIDFFGDEVDLMGYFDTISQRRIENLNSATIIPCKEIISNAESNKAIGNKLNLLLKKFKGTEKRRQTLLSEIASLESGQNVYFDKYFSMIYKEKENPQIERKYFQIL